MNTPSPDTVLRESFGLSEFRPGQRQVIDTLLAGRNALAVFPTGGGKSLCYQLPALLLDGCTLVVSPLIALMKDQVDALTQRGLPAARLDSSLGDEIMDVYRRFDRGEIKLLYVAPERLANERFLNRLRRQNVAMLAVDEAHCISSWGHNFRPDYLKLSRLVDTLGKPRVLALTATATPAVAEDIRSAFSIAADDHVHTGFYRDNLQLKINPCRAEQRDTLLLQRLTQTPLAPTIIYVTLQKTAVDVAAMLRAGGVNATAYHAGLKDDTRRQVQEDFMADRCKVVVATIAFGMGIDKPDVRAIYHYNLPKSIENYMQEIGRAGRDGKPSCCELFANRDDLIVLANFAYGDTPDTTAVTGLVSEVLRLGDPFAVSGYQLSQRYDMRPLVVSTTLMYLELGGLISVTGPFYSQYKIKLLVDEAELLARFDAKRREFLAQLFAQAKPGRSLLTLEPDTAAAELNEDSQRIRRAISYLEEKNLAQVKVAGLMTGYRRPRPLSDTEIDAEIERINHLFQHRETQEIERLAQVVDYAESGVSHWAYLLRYFGETPPPNLTEDDTTQQRTLPGSETTELDAQSWEQLRELRAELGDRIRNERQWAKFLCGLSSPALSKAKLTRHPAYGRFAGYPFASVITFLSTMK